MSNLPQEKSVPPPGSTLLQKLATRRGLILLASFSILFIVLAVAGIFLYLSRKGAVGIALKQPPSLEELAEQFPQLANVLKDDKLDSVYKQFMMVYSENGPEAAYELAKKRGILNDKDEVRITLELNSEETSTLQASLEAHGIKVTAVSGKLMDIAIPIDVLRKSLESDQPGAIFMDISGLDQIIRIRLPIQSFEDVGSVETEGVEVIGAYEWHAAGITGKGVKIGVLDIGFDGYKNLLGSDLPANVVAKSFTTGREIDQIGTVHGSAVSEIIYDIAPEAEFYFASYQTVAEKQAAVDWLMSQGVDMISSSTGSIYGRRDGKGPNAVMVDRVFAQGILWVNSSGNTGYTHYRGQFTDTDGDGYHEFGPGDEYMGFKPDGAASLSLNWDDWDAGIQDFDMYILDKNGNEIASSTDTQNGPGSDAGEFVYYEFPDEGPYYMAIYKVNATRAVTFDFFLRDGLIEYYTPEYSVNTPGDALGAFTVGATDWETGELADYSSRGPTEDERIKPDIIAPSNVSSAAYGETWIGTSASCPHVAGAAALVMQAFPEFTPQQVIEFLTSRAKAMDQPIPNSDTGSGYLFLGSPPEITDAPPAPLPTVSAPEPIPTVANTGAATSTPRPTATPVLENEPIFTSEDSETTIITLLLLGCVVLPGFLGLGGIGLLGAVVFMRRSRSQVGRSTDDRRYWDLPDQPVIQPPAPPPAPVAPTFPCPSCGKQNSPGIRFCTNCGSDLNPPPAPAAATPQFCTKCGSSLRPNVKFCPNCGQPVKPR